MWHTYSWSDTRVRFALLHQMCDDAAKQTQNMKVYKMKACKSVGSGWVSWCVWGQIPNIWTWFLSLMLGSRLQTEVSPSRVKNATDHQLKWGFFLPRFLSRLSPASKADPRSLHHRPWTPGTGEITLYLLSDKVIVRREHRTSPIVNTQKYLRCLVSARGEKSRPPF